MSGLNADNITQREQSIRAYANCVDENLHEVVSAWFLGPQAENSDILGGLFAEAVALQKASRLAYHPEDGAFITPAIRASEAFNQESTDLQTQVRKTITYLYKFSVPFFSQRYAGHMSFETSLPGILGMASTLLCNPNNVAYEASPVTTEIELRVGREMCRMLGYKVVPESTRQEELEGPKNDLEGWGHIACDGTVANLESIWSARNLKYYPLSLRDAMKKELAFIASTFKVPLPKTGEDALFSELDLWQLLNLPATTILDIPNRLHEQFGITPTYLDEVLYDYLVQSRGKQALETEWQMAHSPSYFISATKHYSWPKGAAIAGLGAEYMREVPVDHNARLDIGELTKRLDQCLAEKKPVFAVVGIIGSTEEGAVDPLDKILDLRDAYEKKGLCFLVHADAAWGGYFASMIRKPSPKKTPYGIYPEPSRDFVPSSTLRKSTVDQFHALARTDSITIDPHKAGYIPYPAGGLCYRDGRLKSLLTWSAPYLAQKASGESIGIYGVEGSKPGAPAVATALHHKVVGLHDRGHGALLGEASWSCRRISAHWGAMSTEKDDFIVVPFNPLPAEKDGPVALAQQKEYIRTNILGKLNEDIVTNEAAKDLLCQLGSDLNINVFVCNFRINGKVNEDVEEANYLNNSIFHRLSITAPNILPETIPMFLSSTTFEYEHYGECVQHYKERLGLEKDSQQDLFVLRNVVMTPFQTAGGFVQTIADTFQSVLVEEMQNVVARNTITPQPHTFVLQGIDGNGNAALTYRPYFYNANGRFQLVVIAHVENIEGNTLDLLPCDLVTDSKPGMTIDEICLPGNVFEATTYRRGYDSEGIEHPVKIGRVTVSDVRVIKKRALDSRYRERKYPDAFVPFYFYGSGNNYFVDHMLLRAPNGQLSAQVSIDFASTIPSDALEKGLLLTVDRSDAAMQPADQDSTAWFKEGAEFAVKVYVDPNPTDAYGPGLVNVIAPNKPAPIARGKMILGKPVIDLQRLNRQDFTTDTSAMRRMVSFTSRAAHPQTKLEWRQAVTSMFDE
ncbi:PLP-dependent transferase [Dichomitus squalens]|uniref:PLP-dependent transferase n=1 Tax=Dichomitus squalens TaxID=114155 RepID=A0A4Q9PT05_9APHY|nr:PLP-dependent transferase [Dichomitus squalens]